MPQTHLNDGPPGSKKAKNIKDQRQPICLTDGQRVPRIAHNCINVKEFLPKAAVYTTEICDLSRVKRELANCQAMQVNATFSVHIPMNTLYYGDNEDLAGSELFS